MKTLAQLLEGIPNCNLQGSGDAVITGISANSKDIAAGNLFIAKKGKAFDGGRFIAEAVQAGAAAILTDWYDPAFCQIPHIIHHDAASIEGIIASNYYGNPSDELLMVGITGTNGKTTTSFLVKSLLDQLAGPCGLIGTIEYIIGSRSEPATRTTPDVVSNHRMLREMIDAGCRSAVMEVSSHALDQGRVDRIAYDIAIFSNLSLDHLDYHGTMEEYAHAKKKLFQQLGKGSKSSCCAIVNQDSPWGSLMLDGCTASSLTYGIESQADLTASSIRLEGGRTRAQVAYQGKQIDCSWPLVGRFNVYNCLSAMGAALSLNYPLEQVADLMAALPAVRGRLQPVPNALGIKIFVDFAHSDDALSNVLATLRETLPASGRLLVVFGCGGDRDRSKRSKMGDVCGRMADYSFITADNPRSEDPAAICDEIARGFASKGSYEMEIDRRTAIKKAIERAQTGDIVLIAGKGHETYQIFAHETIPFDDGKVAADICGQELPRA